MAMSPLRIDTSIVRTPGPSSAHSYRTGLAPPSATIRVRAPSPASATSTTSYASPIPSSNASTSSLLIPTDSATYSTPPTSLASKSGTPPLELQVMADYVLAMHDFIPEHNNATCLSFRAGQVIHVLNRDSSGWWDGELDGSRGWFPSNYVNGELGLLVDDDGDAPMLPTADHINHARSRSGASAASLVSSLPSRQGPCPPVMVPLLHALSLLQNAVRSNRVAHFQPSVACIISCVRSILAAIDCLSRDAPLLRRHPTLAQERKLVLADLAAIVTQAKRASAETREGEHDAKEAEIERMVRLGGQVFSRVRRFLAVAVQCGVELPDKEISVEYPSFAAEAVAGPSTPQSTTRDEDATMRLSPRRTTNAVAARTRMRVRDRPGTPGRAKSLSDLRAPRQPFANTNAEPMPAVSKKLEGAPPIPMSTRARVPSHKHEASTSSTSSSSSLSSVGTPTTPPFPTGPSSTEELTDALRHTHGQYLSAIAAFIGHAHAHTRSSHASSTGHAYSLVKEIVQGVCRLLTIVDAVLRHPGVPPHKAQDLRESKKALFDATTGLTDAVRGLTTPLLEGLSEEDEMNALISAATSVLKVGTNCVNAVKVCLARTAPSPDREKSSGDKQFLVVMPRATGTSPPLSPRGFLHAHAHSTSVRGQLVRSASDDGLRAHMHQEEDETVQLEQAPPIEISGTESGEQSRGPSPIPQTPTSPTSPTIQRRLPSPLTIDPTLHARVQPDIPSPLSSARTDDGTTWEGGMHDERVLNTVNALPSLPSVPVPSSGPGHSDAWLGAHDYPLEEVAYNSDGHLVGASLRALVEKLTPHNSLVDQGFLNVFFLTFRLFTTPTDLLQAIITRYNLLPPAEMSNSEELMAVWMQRKGVPVRLRVSNLIRNWLESYWRPEKDNVVLSPLNDFNRDALALMFPGPSTRIKEMVRVRAAQAESFDRGSGTPAMPATPSRPSMSGHMPQAGLPLNLNPPVVNSPSEIPRPIMTKALLSRLRTRDFSSIAVTDFDSLELARQLTLMECAMYCSISPDELLEGSGEGSSNRASVRAMSGLSTTITGWVAESILNETDAKRRTALLKFFIKLADRCTAIHNYSTSRSILAALDSSTIARLHQTWAGVPQKQKHQVEAIRKLADHARNYHEYRSRLRNTPPPAVPFLGLYLTDLTFCREGNPSTRASPLAPDKKLINFNKYHKMARIVQDMQRFQVPYTLKEIPEVQAYLADAFERSKHHGDLQDLYRRSLLVEPKQSADQPPTTATSTLFHWSSRSQTPSVAS
ncbi:ras GEF [Peniophora sp. CONT]|nr:ras GEF [Peniophora sp. CONT]